MSTQSDQVQGTTTKDSGEGCSPVQDPEAAVHSLGADSLPSPLPNDSEEAPAAAKPDAHDLICSDIAEGDNSNQEGQMDGVATIDAQTRQAGAVHSEHTDASSVQASTFAPEGILVASSGQDSADVPLDENKIDSDGNQPSAHTTDNQIPMDSAPTGHALDADHSPEPSVDAAAPTGDTDAPIVETSAAEATSDKKSNDPVESVPIPPEDPVSELKDKDGPEPIVQAAEASCNQDDEMTKCAEDPEAHIDVGNSCVEEQSEDKPTSADVASATLPGTTSHIADPATSSTSGVDADVDVEMADSCAEAQGTPQDTVINGGTQLTTSVASAAADATDLAISSQVGEESQGGSEELVPPNSATIKELSSATGATKVVEGNNDDDEDAEELFRAQLSRAIGSDDEGDELMQGESLKNDCPPEAIQDDGDDGSLPVTTEDIYMLAEEQAQDESADVEDMAPSVQPAIAEAASTCDLTVDEAMIVDDPVDPSKVATLEGEKSIVASAVEKVEDLTKSEDMIDDIVPFVLYDDKKSLFSKDGRWIIPKRDQFPSVFCALRVKIQLEALPSSAGPTGAPPRDPSQLQNDVIDRILRYDFYFGKSLVRWDDARDGVGKEGIREIIAALNSGLPEGCEVGSTVKAEIWGVAATVVGVTETCDDMDPDRITALAQCFKESPESDAITLELPQSWIIPDPDFKAKSPSIGLYPGSYWMAFLKSWGAVVAAEVFFRTIQQKGSEKMVHLVVKFCNRECLKMCTTFLYDRYLVHPKDKQILAAWCRLEKFEEFKARASTKKPSAKAIPKIGNDNKMKIAKPLTKQVPHPLTNKPVPALLNLDAEELPIQATQAKTAPMQMAPMTPLPKSLPARTAKMPQQCGSTTALETPATFNFEAAASLGSAGTSPAAIDGLDRPLTPAEAMHGLSGKQLEAFQMVMTRMERLEKENQELMQILLQMQGLLQQQQQRNARLSQIAGFSASGSDQDLAESQQGQAMLRMSAGRLAQQGMPGQSGPRGVTAQAGQMLQSSQPGQAGQLPQPLPGRPRPLTSMQQMGLVQLSQPRPAMLGQAVQGQQAMAAGTAMASLTAPVSSAPRAAGAVGPPTPPPPPPMRMRMSAMHNTTAETDTNPATSLIRPATNTHGEKRKASGVLPAPAAMTTPGAIQNAGNCNGGMAPPTTAPHVATAAQPGSPGPDDARDGMDDDEEEAPWKRQRRRPRRTRGSSNPDGAENGGAPVSATGGEGGAHSAAVEQTEERENQGLAAYHNALLGV